MNVNSVSFTGAPKAAKKPLTKGQKAAAITGAVVTTAAVASAVAAFAMGKGVEGNILNKLSAGYKAMGSFVANSKAGKWVTTTFNSVKDAVVGFFAETKARNEATKIEKAMNQ